MGHKWRNVTAFIACVFRERGAQPEEGELERTAALLRGSPKECDPHGEQPRGLDGPEGQAAAAGAGAAGH